MGSGTTTLHLISVIVFNVIQSFTIVSFQMLKLEAECLSNEPTTNSNFAAQSETSQGETELNLENLGII